jgi:hypothetical protein
MSTTVLDGPAVQESSMTFPARAEAKNEERSTVLRATREHSNPIVLVFAACVIALHLAGAAVGSVAAWVYFLRHSGAFMP